jgi:Ca2+-binding EF-hand superfamily protein
MRRLPIFLLLCGGCAFAQAPPAEPDAKLKADWEQRFRAADKDASRSLDRQEAQAGLPKVLSRHFDDIDTDHDGLITPEELWAMHQREVVERQKRREARTGPPR